MKLGESVRIGNESYLVTSITKNETGLMIVSFEVEGKIPPVPEGYRILGDDEIVDGNEIRIDGCDRLPREWIGFNGGHLADFKGRTVEYVKKTLAALNILAIARREPKYRPFANAEEFDPHKDRWLTRITKVGKWRVSGFNDKGIFTCDGSFVTYEDASKQHTFIDDNGQTTPFGVKE